MSEKLLNKTIECRHCGKVEKFQWMESTNQELKRRQACFDCNFWLEKVELAERGFATVPGDIVRVENVHYIIGKEPIDRHQPFLGHAGRKFEIVFNDGRKVISHNLWCQGTIPEHFRDRLPNNAKFIWS